MRIGRARRYCSRAPHLPRRSEVPSSFSTRLVDAETISRILRHHQKSALPVHYQICRRLKPTRQLDRLCTWFGPHQKEISPNVVADVEPTTRCGIDPVG